MRSLAWSGGREEQPQEFSQQPPEQPPNQSGESHLSGGFCNLLIFMVFMAPEVGLEPTTLRLTAECSAIELLRSMHETQGELRCASSVITNAANRVKDIQRSYRSDLVTWTNDSRTMRSLARRVGDGWNRGCCSGLGVQQDGYVVAGEGATR